MQCILLFVPLGWTCYIRPQYIYFFFFSLAEVVSLLITSDNTQRP